MAAVHLPKTFDEYKGSIEDVVMDLCDEPDDLWDILKDVHGTPSDYQCSSSF